MTPGEHAPCVSSAEGLVEHFSSVLRRTEDLPVTYLAASKRLVDLDSLINAVPVPLVGCAGGGPRAYRGLRRAANGPQNDHIHPVKVGETPGVQPSALLGHDHQHSPAGRPDDPLTH